MTQWSPAFIVALTTEVVAAMPVPKTCAATPPSSCATFFCNVLTVGLFVRL